MLAKEQIENNKSKYISLIKSIKRDGFDSDRFIDFLTKSSDFFTAPASVKYHNSYEGGLCEHSLNVYYCMLKLCENFYDKTRISTGGELSDEIKDSIKICALCHDLAKVNFYTTYYKNEKVYDEFGSKRDNVGTFDWVTNEYYTVRDANNRFIYGNHEETSEMLARCYVPLKFEESVAILHHHSGMGFDSSKVDISTIYTAYPLACLLHLADMIDVYVK